LNFLLWKDYIISNEDRLKIADKTNSLLQAGRPLKEATEVATKDVLSKTSEFKTRERIKKLSERELEAKLNKSIASFYSTQNSSYKFKSSDMIKVIKPDWTVTFTNRVTGDTITAMEDGTQIIQVWTNVQWWAINRIASTEIPLKSQQTSNKSQSAQDDIEDIFNIK